MAKSGSEFLQAMKQKVRDGTLKTVFRDWKWIWQFISTDRRVRFYIRSWPF